MTDWGQVAAERLRDLTQFSEPGIGITRLPYTNDHRRALKFITGLMREAGLSVALDAAGTLVGHLDGPAGSATLLMGSHQDSVRQGGAFDGIMGVILPILAIQSLVQDGWKPPFNIECLAFADEEGVRFPTALIGPRAMAGTFDPATLEMTDQSGTRMRDAMDGFGLAPDQVQALRRSPDQTIGYLETHIEQGPVLEGAGEALEVVTAICGIERHRIILTGETGHAGTLPMASRRDALVGAAAIITEVHRLAHATEDLRATIGSLALSPNSVNAVPSRVELSLEIRSPSDSVRQSAAESLSEFCQKLARQTGLALDMEGTYTQAACPCDPELSGILEAAVRAAGGSGLHLPSGATHDASAMADLCPIAMLFVRCRNGISHAPQEHADADDMQKAITAIAEFLRRVGKPA